MTPGSGGEALFLGHQWLEGTIKCQRGETCQPFLSHSFFSVPVPC